MEFTEAWDDTCSAVGLAARHGKYDEMIKLINMGRSVNTCDNRGWRPLHEAANCINIRCLEELLKLEQTFVNWTTHEGETALLLVCKRRKIDTEAYAVVKMLLDHGADINLIDNDQDTPLLCATRGKLESTIRLMLSSPDVDVNKGDSSDWRPLHEAVSQGNVDLVISMLKANASLDVQDECGMTPLFTAAQVGSYDCLKVLLEEAELRQQKELVNKGAQDWATPLMIAAQQGFTRCVKLLLAHGANPNLKTIDHVTALHLAVQGHNHQVLSILIEVMNVEELKRNSVLKIEKVGERYRAVNNPDMINPLQLAVEWQSHDCLRLLLQSGFPVDSHFVRSELKRERLYTLPLPHYDTPLSLAVSKSDLDAIHILIQFRANCNINCPLILHPVIADALGTRLHDNRVLSLLVENGAKINFHRRGPPANDCLLAALWNPSKLVKLLRYGADPNMFFKDDVSSNILLEGLFRAYQTPKPIIHVLCLFTLFMKPNSFFKESVNKAVDRSLEEFRENHKQQLWDALINKINSPYSLKSISRINIRQLFYERYDTALESYLGQLNLPFPLPYFLCYDEIGSRTNQPIL